MAKKPETTKTLLYNTFSWKGVNKSGILIKGQLSAASLSLAKAELRNQGIIPKNVRIKSKPLFNYQSKKITSSDIALFSRQLSIMMNAGVPLVQAFDIIGRSHAKPCMQQLILSIKNNLESGMALHQAIAKHPDYFDELFCNLIAAGEQSGSLDIMLKRVANYKEQTESLKKKIKKALVYPAIVFLIAIFVTAILLLFVVPQFETLFKGFGAELPMFTRMIVSLSRFLQQSWWLLLLIIVITVFSFNQAKRRSEKFRHGLDVIRLKLPVIGKILQKAAIANYTRTLAITFTAGLPLVDALESVARTVGNHVYSQGILHIRDQVAVGHRIQFAMQMTNLFPNMVVQMVGIGEEAGSLDTVLNKIADLYEEDVNHAVDNLSSLLEPMIMVILGIIIGVLVTAMYLPIFNLGQAI